MSRVILLAGPAAAGKSTIARELQTAFAARGEMWLLMQLDTFARGIPRDWIAWPRRQGVRGARGFTYAASGELSIALTIGEDGRRVLSAFHRAVAGATAHASVICETIVHDEADWRDWSAALAGIDALWIWLSAPLAVLEARERANETRIFHGLARGMLARQRVGAFELEADTSVEDAGAIVARILAVPPSRSSV